MIPVRVQKDLTWYLDLLRNDGLCCEIWKKWSGKLHKAGVSCDEKRSWHEWKDFFLSNAETKECCWGKGTWERYGKLLQANLDRQETLKYWHQRVHAAKYDARRKRKWGEWGKKLKECGFEQILPDVPEKVDSDPDIALTEKLFVARYTVVQRVREYMDTLRTEDPQKYRILKGLGDKIRREYETFPDKEINIEIQQELGVHTCPYCNSQYMKTRVDHNTGRRHAGMQIDHFHSQGKYGILAMSLLNLVPSCSCCNHEKGENDLQISVYREDIHAYDTVFRYEPAQPDNADFLINMDVTLYLQVSNRKETNRENARAILSDKCDVLHLAQRIGNETDRVKYDQGLEEAKKIIENVRNNPMDAELFVRELGFPPVETSQKWYCQLLGWTPEEDYLKSPFGKLKSDIITQLLGDSVVSEQPVNPRNEK